MAFRLISWVLCPNIYGKIAPLVKQKQLRAPAPYMGESTVDVGVDAADGFQYVLVILEDVSGYTWLRPSRACTANCTVLLLVR